MDGLVTGGIRDYTLCNQTRNLSLACLYFDVIGHRLSHTNRIEIILPNTVEAADVERFLQNACYHRGQLC